MSLDIKAAIKKPWVKYALIAVGVIGAYLIFNSASSSSSDTTNSTGESDADYAADAQTAQTQIQASAAAASQGSAQTFQLQQQTESDQTNLAALGMNIGAQENINTSNNTTSVSLANISLQGLQSQLDEASHVNDNETAVYLNGQDSTAGVAKNASNNATKASTVGAIGSLAAVAAVAFF